MATLYIQYSLYKSQGVVPADQDDGINKGRPKLIPNLNIKCLNQPLETIGLAEKLDRLLESMTSTKNKKVKLRGVTTSAKTPYAQKFDHYNTKSV